MKTGQALRWVFSLLLFLPLLAGLVLGVLAWRLASGPMESGLLARQIERAANAQGGELRLSIGQAAIAWEGFRSDGAPLTIRITGARMTDDGGRMLGVLPDAAITLALGPLLRGILAPATVDLFAPSLRLRREADGSLHLDTPEAAQAPAATDEAPSALPYLLADLMRPPEERAIHTLLRRVRMLDGNFTLRDPEMGMVWTLENTQLVLLRRAEGGLDADGEATLIATSDAGAALTVPVHVSGQAAGEPADITLRLDLPVLRPAELAAVLPPLAQLSAVDAPLALQARVNIDGEGRVLSLGLAIQSAQGGIFRPAPGMAIPFTALEVEALATPDRVLVERAVLRLPGEAERPLEVSAELRREAPGWAGRAQLGLGGLDITAVTRLWPPGMAPVTREAARLALTRGTLREGQLLLDMTAAPDLTRWSVTGAQVALRLEDAEVSPPGLQPLAVREAVLDARLSPGMVTVDTLSLELPAPAEGVPPTRITGSGAARLAEGRWNAELDVGLDHARFEDLPSLWPAGLGEGARYWITRNITAGVVREGRWRFAASAAPDMSGARLDDLSGQAVMAEATIHYLRPMPPVAGVSGRATFSRQAVEVLIEGGALPADAGGVQARDATLRFIFAPAGEPDTAEMRFNLAGPLTGLVTVLRHPRLNLFTERRPFPLAVAAGTFTGQLNLSFPLVADLRTEQLQLRTEAQLTGARVTSLLLEQDLEGASAELTSDMRGLRANGNGTLAGVAVRFGVELDFRAGAATQVISRETLSARPTAAQLAAIGLDAGDLVRGPIAITARGERRRNGTSSYALTGDLRDAVLAFAPLGWEKPVGSPGRAEATLRMQGANLVSIENIRLEALDLALRARAVVSAGRVTRVELQETIFGGSRLVGDARAGARVGEPWTIALRGPLLDLRPVMGRNAAPPRGADAPASRQPPLNLSMRFDQVLLGPGREIFAVQATGRMDNAGVLREASLRGSTARGAGPFEATLTPALNGARELRALAEDGGGALRLLGITRSIQGGRLGVVAQYADARPGAALAGVAEMENFVVRDAPALGKLLQAMTLFGLVDAVQGGSGLSFSRAVVPFILEPEVLRIQEARAFSASLGLTARGRLLRERSILDMEGTIVPAYIFNTLLGNLPLIGRLFSPETGGGLFAATFRVQGTPEDPTIAVNPLAALTPGFLRGLFDLGGEGTEGGAEPRR